MIYIAAHKKFHVPRLEGYCPLQVGAEGKADLGYIRDNTGENISSKNPNFCELTGIYWIWKNCDDDYKGLVHYRRYFGKSNLSSRISDIYSYNELRTMLDKNVEIILPYKERFLQNAKDELMISCCTEKIFEQLRQAVLRVHPESIDAFNAFFTQNTCTLFNMMFCKKEIFDDYCGWLFDILFELEKHVKLDSLNEYQKRLYGFLSERLLNVWVRQKRLRTKNLRVISTEMPLDEKQKLIRRRITNSVRYTIRTAFKTKLRNINENKRRSN